MPTMYYELHHERVLWPEHRSLEDVMRLMASTPAKTWETTYQGNLYTETGSIFQRNWWDGMNRYEYGNHAPGLVRFVSLDTATGVNETNAFTAWVVGDITPDYRLMITGVGRERLEFDELVDKLGVIYRTYNNGLLRNIVIENKSSGIQLLQTMRHTSGIGEILQGFDPRGAKPERWAQASPWCKNGSVLLPYPCVETPWLLDFEEEIFSVPSYATMDQADAFSQLILFLENFLAIGLDKRSNLQ